MTNATIEKEMELASKLDETKLMPMTPEEVVASLRTLVYFAKADGVLSPEEKSVLEESFQGLALPSGPPLESFLNSEIVLSEELPRIVSLEARERTYNAAFCLAYAEGSCSTERQRVLKEIREGLKISPERATLLGRMYADTRDWVIPGTINPIADDAARTAAVDDYILKFSIVNAVSGAVPIPVFSILTDLLIVSVQVKMVRDIGQYWGHKVDREAARSIMASVLGATGMRIAVHSVLNVVPILGSAIGAASAFVTTWALGKVANQYFASGGKLTTEDLREMYQSAKHEAREAYDKSKHLISNVRDDNG